MGRTYIIYCVYCASLNYRNHKLLDPRHVQASCTNITTASYFNTAVLVLPTPAIADECTGWSLGVYDFLCVWATNTKVGTHIVHGRHSVYTDPEVKRSKVKVTRRLSRSAGRYDCYLDSPVRFCRVGPATQQQQSSNDVRSSISGWPASDVVGGQYDGDDQQLTSCAVDIDEYTSGHVLSDVAHTVERPPTNQLVLCRRQMLAMSIAHQ